MLVNALILLCLVCFFVYINSVLCINFQMSLISSSSNFCHHTLQVSSLPVTFCSVRSGYFSLCWCCFLCVVLAVLCKKLVIPFLSFSNLTGSAAICPVLLYYLFPGVFCESVWCTTCEKLLWIHEFYKALFCCVLFSFALFCHSLWTNNR